MTNYKRLGDYIQEVDVRNEGLNVDKLLGLTINKQFISSVANTIGTDMENYKIIRKNQFACSTMQVRRDGKMPVALLKDFDEAIISQAYPVFEVKDANQLLPDYLMMWFSRAEFDREACFHAVGGVRGSLEWEDFLNMQLPVPSLEKQQEIIAEYHAVQNRINLNNKLIQKLEETAQAIYKQWFVDFEFPDESGKPYKSNGGEMVESEMGEVPRGWKVGKLGDIVQTQYGYTASAETNNIGPKFLRITDIANGYIDWENVPNCEISKSNFKKYELKAGDIVVARTGATVGCAKRINKQHPKTVFASYLVRLIPNDEILSYYLGLTVDSRNYKDYILSKAEGSAQPQANASLMTEYSVIKPNRSAILSFNKNTIPIIDQIEIFQIQNSKLKQFKELLLSKIAKGRQ